MELEDNVKIVHSSEGSPTPIPPSMVWETEASKAKGVIVTHAIESAREAASHLEEAIDWAAVLRPSHENKALLVRVRQFVEEMEQTL